MGIVFALDTPIVFHILLYLLISLRVNNHLQLMIGPVLLDYTEFRKETLITETGDNL